MIYTKITGTIANAEDLLLTLSSNLVSYGWTQEFIGDNIISSVNLGKKLIMKKGAIYTYFAASDNNDPTQDNSSFSSISCLKFCCSNVLNTTNAWYNNDARSLNRNNQTGIQFSTGASYKLYINNDNFILNINFATGLYSNMIIGNTNRNAFYATGSIIGTQITSGRLTNYPLFSELVENKTVFKNDIVITNTLLSSVLKITSTGEGSNPFTRASITLSNDVGIINRSSNSLGTCIFNIKYYKLVDGSKYSPVFDIDDIGLVNFKEMSSTQSENEGKESGLKVFDYLPFLKKETPQTYSNTETYGCGLAIRVG